ncbi:hypothetical protein GN244_ATG19134 [Phytophthora infestans]|uniref:Uncharacterized protein n=1 Tax=Phytophthora infestans TaxID=4787 RepID=A0A833VUE7_PHYIN|nr:hypothetical protein GN244_ATG19134 [Phytophthora infestans]
MASKIYNKRERAESADSGDNTIEGAVSNTQTVKRRCISAATSFKDAWYSWFAQEPRMCRSTDAATKHTRATFKMNVTFMKLPPEAFKLSEKSPTYRE